MMVGSKNIIRKLRVLQSSLCLFSENNEQTKIETRSFKKNVVNDFTKLAYESPQRLQFTNNKCLIYKNTRTLLTTVIQASYYLVPIASIAYTIYINPFADIFPAAIPILGFIDLVLLKLWMNKIKWNQNIVSEIYLLENGEATEIWFANKFKRRLFGQELKKLYYNSVFTEPDYDKQEVLLLNREARMFPLSMQEAEKKNPGYAWVKYYSNGQNCIIIPKKSEHSNMKILIEIFKGKIIRNKH